MKLGIHIPIEFYSASQAVKTAKLVDVAGLDHVVVNDHLRLPRGPNFNEAWTVWAGLDALCAYDLRIVPAITTIEQTIEGPRTIIG
ncbi:MAG: hypothetical protein ACFFBR_08185 [Promethearchaeota archaeon]